jgi:signal peptidase II
MLLLTLLPIVAIVLIARFLFAAREPDTLSTTSLALILGGAVGNLVDRLVRGEVVDFLDVYAPPSRLADWLVGQFGTAHWPTFNVADSAIVVGAGLMLLGAFRTPQASAQDAPERAAADRAEP